MNVDKAERDAKILEMLAAGESWPAIMREVGVTKGVVAGLSFRHKAELANRPKPAGKPVNNIDDPNSPMISPYDGEPNLHLMDLRESSCRFLMDEGSDGLLRYCGKRQITGNSSYCFKHHRQLGYTASRHAPPLRDLRPSHKGLG